ncbi:fimbrial biogenesis chaperone [Deinococcus sp.]|uniref:fimbrial biogenesis chaperone n=1 Tax=Deinococcus sp. TaxID=47478 RepID=UPI003CC5B1B1
MKTQARFFSFTQADPHRPQGSGTPGGAASRLLALALALLLAGAQADPFGVAPTLIELRGSQRTASISITNPSAQLVKYEVSASAWSQPSGDDAFQPTSDLVLTPPVFSLKPGGSQIVRVGLKVPATPGSPERAYRVYIAQLATPQAQASTPTDQVTASVRVLFKIALPMFVLPETPAPKVAWEVARAGQTTTLTLNNTGNSYVRYGGLKLMQGDKLIGSKIIMYALAGQHHTLTFNTPVEPGKVTVTYEVNQEPHTETLVVQ